MKFVIHNPGTAFIVLGSVFLALTGGEALYADMGHFRKKPDVQALLSLLQKQIPGWTYDVGDMSFFLARDTIRATGENKVMALWREKLFAFLGRNAAQAAEYFSLPPNRVVEMGCSLAGVLANTTTYVQAFFTYALHHPFALTCLPLKTEHGPPASPGLPW